MDINFTPEELAFRDEVRVFLDTKLPKEIASKVKNGQHLSKDDTVRWQKILNEQGWMALHWPKEHGGTMFTPNGNTLGAPYSAHSSSKICF